MKQCCQVYLDEQFGDPEIAKEIYDEYVRSVKEKAQDAQEALAASDWTRLDRTAHTIKGNALATGDNEMAEVAIALRNDSHLANADSAKTHLDKICSLLTTL